MTAVLACPAPAPAPDVSSAANYREAAALYTWVLSVRDWRVHALAQPGNDGWCMLATRCGQWEPIGCPVSVARRDELCPRCAARGIARLELLPPRETDGTAAR